MVLCPSVEIYCLHLNILSFLHLPHIFSISKHIVLLRPEQMDSVYETNGTFVYRFHYICVFYHLLIKMVYGFEWITKKSHTFYSREVILTASKFVDVSNWSQINGHTKNEHQLSQHTITIHNCRRLRCFSLTKSISIPMNFNSNINEVTTKRFTEFHENEIMPCR